MSAILQQEAPQNFLDIHSSLSAINTYQLMWFKWAHSFNPLSDKSCKILLLDSLSGWGLWNFAHYIGCGWSHCTAKPKYSISHNLSNEPSSFNKNFCYIFVLHTFQNQTKLPCNVPWCYLNWQRPQRNPVHFYWCQTLHVQRSWNLTLPLSTTVACINDIHSWKQMVPLISLSSWQDKMILPIPSRISHSVVYWRFQKGRICLKLSKSGLDTSNDLDLLECFLIVSLPKVAANHLVDLKWILDQQNIRTEFAIKAAKYPDWYFNELFDGYHIVWYDLLNYNFTQWRIAITKEMIIPLVNWYYTFNPWVKAFIDGNVSKVFSCWKFPCKNCQQTTTQYKGLGLSPEYDFTNTLSMKLLFT